jgi:hypothetical protein
MMEETAVATIEINDDRIIQAANEDLVDTTPEATTPPPIDQVLVYTPLFNV